jgi:hypothetical protein
MEVIDAFSCDERSGVRPAFRKSALPIKCTKGINLANSNEGLRSVQQTAGLVVALPQVGADSEVRVELGDRVRAGAVVPRMVDDEVDSRLAGSIRKAVEQNDFGDYAWAAWVGWDVVADKAVLGANDYLSLVKLIAEKYPNRSHVGKITVLGPIQRN